MRQRLSDLNNNGSVAAGRTGRNGEPSVDMPFSSPQISQDRSVGQKPAPGFLPCCCSYLFGCFAFIAQFVLGLTLICRTDPIPMSDPMGATLSFMEMCEAVRHGQLSMGIIVTHPKVATHHYIVQDDDYESDEESEYGDESESRSGVLSSVDSSSAHSTSSSQPLPVGGTAAAKGATSTSKSPKPPSALRRTYGDKAEEVTKFYNIMMAADMSMAAANGTSADRSMSVASSPDGPSSYTPAKMLVTHAPSMVSPPRKDKTAGVDPSDPSSGPGSHLPPQEYTDLSPFRTMRRLSKNIDRDSMLMNPRTSEFDASTEGRRTEEDITNFNSFRDRATSMATSSAGSIGEDFDDNDEENENSNEVKKGAMQPKHSNNNQKQLEGDAGGMSMASQVSPVTLDRKSLARKKKRGSKRLRKDLTTESLAYSAYQCPVNAWRLNENQECISDGLMQLGEQILSGARSFSGASVASSAGGMGSIDDSVDRDERLRLSSVVAHTGDRVPATPSTPSPLSASPMNKSRNSLGRGSNKPPQSPWYNIRSFLGATSTSKANISANSMSFSEEKAGRSDAASEVTSDVGSVINNGDSNSELSVKQSTEAEAAEEKQNSKQRESQIITLLRQRSRRMAAGGPSGYRPFYFVRLVVFYLRNFVLGSNVYPIGPKYVRKVLELLIFVLCIVDLALSIIVLTNAYCASDNATACTNHTSMVLMVTVWPGALFIAPIMGLVTVVMGPSGTLARIYAMWSRIAGINGAVVTWSLVFYFNYFYNVPGSVYPFFVLLGSRLFQCLFVDLYVAHIERIRYTHGWDGLHTSLYKTQDNRQEVII